MSSLLDQPRLTLSELAHASRMTVKKLKGVLAEHGIPIDAPGTKRQGVYTVQLRDRLGVFCESLEDVEERRARRGEPATDETDPDPA